MIENTRFNLSKPLRLSDGTEISELTLDWDSLSMADLKSAQRIANMVAENNNMSVEASVVSKRLDSNLQLGVSFVAALKGTKGLMLNDVLNLSLVDALCLSEEALSSYLFR
jgi:hypothetical protein